MSHAFLEDALETAGFGDAVVNIFVDSFVVWGDTFQVSEVVNYCERVPVIVDLVWSVCFMWRLLKHYYSFLKADGLSKGFDRLSKAVDDSRSAFLVCSRVHSYLQRAGQVSIEWYNKYFPSTMFSFISYTYFLLRICRISFHFCVYNIFWWIFQSYQYGITRCLQIVALPLRVSMAPANLALSEKST